MKEIFKLNLTKIILTALFVAVLVISFFVNLEIFNSLFYVFWWPSALVASIFTPQLRQVNVFVFIISLLVNSVYLYFLSCLIYWVYVKVFKKTERNF